MYVCVCVCVCIIVFSLHNFHFWSKTGGHFIQSVRKDLCPTPLYSGRKNYLPKKCPSPR